MLRKFWKSEDGNYAVIFSLALVPIMVAVGGAIDTTHTMNKADQLQNSLDASAGAIAAKYYHGMSQEDLTELGREFFEANMAGIDASVDDFVYHAASKEFEVAASNKAGEDYITVSSGFKHDGMLRYVDWRAHRQSVVRIKKGAPACILALDPHAAAAVKIQGTSDTELVGCVIAANSDSGSAVDRGGSAALAAGCVNTVGETRGINGSSYVKLECGPSLERQYPSYDPLFHVARPAYTSCQQVPGGKTKTLSPGTYCGKTFSGEITLEPGVYILRGGRINLGGNGSLVGSGVTLFLTEDAEFSIQANQVVNLTPPATGPFAGITIHQERSNTTTISVNGTSGSAISGFVYAPGAHIYYAGTSDTTASGRCLRLVGNTIEITGTSAISSDCSSELGGRTMFASRYMAFVR